MLNSTNTRFAIGAALATAALAAAAYFAPAIGEQGSPRLLPPPPRRLPPPLPPRAIAEPLPVVAPPPRMRKTRTKPEAPASEFTKFADYEIRRYKTDRVGPSCVVTWSDGESTRLSVATLPGKPLNIGRALRVSLAAWESRKRCKYRASVITNEGKPPRFRVPTRATVTACRFERDGEIIGRFDPAECNRSLEQRTI